MSVVAVIVARGGSQRLPNKALLPFEGTSLVGHKVRTLKACGFVDRVVVGSDADAILEEAAKHGADAVRRDAYHCDESVCPANDMLADMAAKVGGSHDDLIVWAHPTNPLVRSLTYDAAIHTYRDATAIGYDSLCSVTSIRRHAWRDGHPMNFNPHAGRHQLASTLDVVQFQDGAIFIQPRGAMLINRYFYGSRPYLFPIDAIEGWDVDTAGDLVAARALVSCVR